MARRFVTHGPVESALSIAELRHRARRRLPAFVFEYLEGGAEDEVTLRRNRAVFEAIAFLPRTLVPGGTVEAGTTLFGRPLALPLVVAPTGFCGLFRRDGDLYLARAAAASGIPFCQSTVSNARLETVSAVGGLRHWMQLYVFRSQTLMEALVARAAAAGCEALVLTTDAAVFGNREWDRRNYRAGTDPTLRAKLEALRHPGWLLDVLRHGLPAFENLLDALPEGERTPAAAATWSRRAVDPDLDWARVAWLRARWPGRLLLKGLLAPDDVRLARDAGVDGVVLSNHGGRQLDGAVSAIEVLPEIAARFGGDLSILVDGGVRRGTDIAKAVALGARAVMVGRATLYGLAAGGEPGAHRALAILAEEYRRTLALLGRPSTAELGPDCVRTSSPFSAAKTHSHSIVPGGFEVTS